MQETSILCRKVQFLYRTEHIQFLLPVILPTTTRLNSQAHGQCSSLAADRREQTVHKARKATPEIQDPLTHSPSVQLLPVTLLLQLLQVTLLHRHSILCCLRDRRVTLVPRDRKASKVRKVNRASKVRKVSKDLQVQMEPRRTRCG